MKKILIICSIIIVMLSIYKKNNIVIPKESIRFRIVANSNDEKDQLIKKEVLNNLMSELQKTNDFSNIEETREYIKKEIPVFNNIVDKTLKENNYKKDFNISYGKNYFPQKEYKNVIYESLVISLGDGQRLNFWCVLFPPLCLVDETEENVEYDSIIKEIINKYF